MLLQTFCSNYGMSRNPHRSPNVVAYTDDHVHFHLASPMGYPYYYPSRPQARETLLHLGHLNTAMRLVLGDKRQTDYFTNPLTTQLRENPDLYPWRNDPHKESALTGTINAQECVWWCWFIDLHNLGYNITIATNSGLEDQWLTHDIDPATLERLSQLTAETSSKTPFKPSFTSIVLP